MNDPEAAVGAIADHLASRRDAILAAWANVARRDPELSAPAALSRVQFFDHIPQLLDALVCKLRSGFPPVPDAPDHATAASTHYCDGIDDPGESAEGNGIQRWQQGYDEGEVMREWISLNACIADELEAFALAHPEADQ